MSKTDKNKGVSDHTTLSEFIAGLQAIEKEHGDLPVIYASDDEGNGFDYVLSLPTVVTANEIQDRFCAFDVPDKAVVIN